MEVFDGGPMPMNMLTGEQAVLTGTEGYTREYVVVAAAGTISLQRPAPGQIRITVTIAIMPFLNLISDYRLSLLILTCLL